MLDLIYVNLIILSLDFAVVVLLYLNQTVRRLRDHLCPTKLGTQDMRQRL